MKTLFPARVLGWLSTSLVAAATFSSLDLRAEEASQPLAAVVVSATRTPQELTKIPNSVTVLSLAELQLSQVEDLRTALSQVPGVYVASSGPVGSQSSIFLRGASSHQTLLVVDGVRMNDRSTPYQNYFGGADLAGLDRLEVLRGPQGTLYGSSAAGGVVLVDTAKGCGPKQGVLAFQAGSFETYTALAALSGGSETTGYSLSLSRLETANEQADNGYRSWSAAGRLETLATEKLLLGLTYRGQRGDYEEVGSRFWASKGRVEADNDLVTTYARFQANETFSSRLTAAHHRRDYVYASAWSTSHSRNTRWVGDWQNTWTPRRELEVVAGLNLEDAKSLAGGKANTDSLAAAYLSGTYHPTSATVFNWGLRHDDHESYGSSSTWRTGASHNLATTGTTLRATYGTGFTAPGIEDRFGVVSWGQLPNPALKAEQSRGWDLGLSQGLLKGKATVSATYFSTKYRELFEWTTTNFTTFEGMIVNRSRASTSGVELAGEARLGTALSTRVAYTWLRARNDENGARLIRRPRHFGDAEVRYQVDKTWLLGLGVHVVADRLESGVRMEDYTSLRFFTRYELGKGLALKFRVENMLDEAYEEVLGYPALPLGAYASLEWRF